MKFEIQKNGLDQYIVVRVFNKSSFFDYIATEYLYRRLEDGPWAFSENPNYAYYFESLREAEHSLDVYKRQGTWEVVKTYEDL